MGRSSWGGGLALAAWASGAAACAGWVGAGATGWRVPLALGAVLATGAAALVAWWRQPSGLIAWDGAAWSLATDRGEAVGGRLEVALDLQRTLLARWRHADGNRWLWLERGRLPTRWDALRRAVYSRADRDALPGAEPPPA